MIDTNALRKKVLDLAIRGKLVPQDPNDEPASVLLERIREEKQRLIKEGKIKKDKVDSIIFKGDDNCYYEKIGNSEPVLLEDLPFQLPDGWTWCRVNNYVQQVTDFVASGSFASLRENVTYYKTENYALLVKIQDFSNNFTDDLTYTDEHGYNFLSNSNIFGGELILSNVGSIGKIFIVPNLNRRATLAPNAIMVRPYNSAHTKWLYYLFSSNIGLSWLLSISSATAIQKFNKTDFKTLLIPVPPFDEQTRIVNHIENIFEYIDIIEKNQADYASLVESLKKAILQSAIQGKLVEQDSNDEPASILLEHIREEKRKQLGKKYVESYIYKGDDNRYYEKVGTKEPILLDDLPFEIPSSWSWARLNNTVEINPRNVIDDDIEVSFVEMKSIKDGFNNNFTYDIKFWKLIKTGYTHFQNGDVGFAKITPCFENRKSVLFKGLKNGYGAGTTELHILRCNETLIFPEYILYFLKSPYLIEYGLKKYTGNAGQQRFATNDVKQTLIPIPPYKEQVRICKKIKEIFDAIKDED